VQRAFDRDAGVLEAGDVNDPGDAVVADRSLDKVGVEVLWVP